ncbi:MAG: outer membrane beta-barrel protein [Gemmatimonadota bacterium]|nr:outer membrane beta-barrel protein [Gemmatimonadota bacterium]
MRRNAARILAVVALIAFGASPVTAQFTINARAGLGVPTGTIADSDNAVLGAGATSGFGWGAGLAYGLGDRWTLRGNFDMTMHEAETTDGSVVADVDVLHFIGGLGYQLTTPGNPFYISVNAGAGALSFKVGPPDGGDSETETYFAINAGAEIGYWLSDSFAIFASPQGDIAFSDEDVFGTSTSFVWPFTAGLKVRLGS